MNSEAWRGRAPSQRERILADLRRGSADPTFSEARRGWVCALPWNRQGIFRYGARIWELRHGEGHEIEERICAEHHVAEYRLVRDADEGL